MKVYLAEHRGLCFGVRDALEMAKEVERPDEVTIFGELVHNPIIQHDLRQRGFETLSETQREDVARRKRVMITAHGVSHRQLAILHQSAQEVIDTTCPLVRRVHEAARAMHDEGRLIVLLGKSNHVEVKGVVEDLTHFVIVEKPEHVECWHQPQLGVLCQSTTMPDVAQACLERIHAMNPEADIRYVDTICRPTRQRQEALVSLCQKVSLIIVVGGHSSNNTQQLVQRAKLLGCNAFGVETAEELRDAWFQGHEAVGLTAGTSTPDATIDQVQQRIEQIAQHQKKSFSKSWRAYFERNLRRLSPISWSTHPTLSLEERNSVLKSIQVFQLGESGTGRHFLKVAQRWADSHSDADYIEAVQLFLKEEHRHADLLHRYLTQEGMPILEKQWSDGCFRKLRKLSGLRTIVTVLVSAEILAKVYYRALQLATQSTTLRQICQQILHDEVPHVEFQVAQLARIDRCRSGFVRWCSRRFDVILFLAASSVLYWEHRSVFRAAGWTLRDYSRKCWRHWRIARMIYVRTYAT